MTNNLAACPFCDSTDGLEVMAHPDSRLVPKLNKQGVVNRPSYLSHRVTCHDCGTLGPFTYQYGAGSSTGDQIITEAMVEADAKMAAVLWNARGELAGAALDFVNEVLSQAREIAKGRKH